MNSNEPAFPCPTGTDGGAICLGMTKLEYFTAAAMAGILADETVALNTHENYEAVANQSVRIAKATLAALESESGLPPYRAG